MDSGCEWRAEAPELAAPRRPKVMSFWIIFSVKILIFSMNNLDFCMKNLNDFLYDFLNDSNSHRICPQKKWVSTLAKSYKLGFFPEFCVEPCQLVFCCSKFGLSRLNPKFSNGPKLPQNSHHGFPPHVRVEPDQLKSHFSGFIHLCHLWLPARWRCWSRWWTHKTRLIFYLELLLSPWTVDWSTLHRVLSIHLLGQPILKDWVMMIAQVRGKRRDFILETATRHFISQSPDSNPYWNLNFSPIFRFTLVRLADFTCWTLASLCSLHYQLHPVNTGTNQTHWVVKHRGST